MANRVPEWVKRPSSSWPKTPMTQLPETVSEVKSAKTAKVASLSTQVVEREFLIDLSRFSSLLTLLRSTATVLKAKLVFLGFIQRPGLAKFDNELMQDAKFYSLVFGCLIVFG